MMEVDYMKQLEQLNLLTMAELLGKWTRARIVWELGRQAGVADWGTVTLPKRRQRRARKAAND